MMKALYAGSFDPIHAGHIDIIKRAVRSFGSIVLLVADNPSKTYKLSPNERIKWIGEILDAACITGVTIEYLGNKFLGEYCAEMGITHIVKGLRNGTDLESEMTQEWYTKKLNENVETIYFSTSEDKRWLSSSAIKTFTEMNHQDFIKYLKKINKIENMDEEKFETYIDKIYTIYGKKNG